MKFVPTALEGVNLIELERQEDERGFFARTWDTRLFGEHGLREMLVQCSVSFNNVSGTLRGMHYQAAPHEEAKLVRCTAGAIFDVAVDLRPQSRTFRNWVGAHLTAENGQALYIPEGCAHGFLTLVDATEVLYQMSHPYVPAASRGVRWNDSAFDIGWPAEILVINERDSSFPDFQALVAHELPS